MLALVGNSPSSGSSLLADLLDSTPYSCCGEELGLFSVKGLYDFNSYKKNIFITSSTSSIYRQSTGLETNELHSYGLSIEKFQQICKSPDSFLDFTNRFTSYYIALRGKRNDAIVFEKTPENISCIGEFLEASDNSWFIHIVRNPLYVYNSLLKRGFPPYISLCTWLIDIASYMKYKDHERVILIKYEDLVANPFQLVATIIKQVSGHDVTAHEIENNYVGNQYKQMTAIKLNAWSIKEYGKISNANEQSISQGIMDVFSYSYLLKVGEGYAEHFGLPQVSFEEALKLFGYWDALKPYYNHPPCEVKKTYKDVAHLIRKYLSDIKKGTAKVKDIHCYLNPVSKIH